MLRRRWPLWLFLLLFSAAMVVIATRRPLPTREARKAALPLPSASPGRHASAPGRWKIDSLPPEWRPEVAQKLAVLFSQAEAPPASAAGTAREPALVELDGFLASLGFESIPTLDAVLGAEGSEEQRRRIVSTLGRLGSQSEDATAALVDFLHTRTGDAMAGGELANCVKVMGALKNKTSFEALLEMVLNPRFPAELKALAVRSLAEHPRGAEEAALFVKLIREARDPHLRAEAASALGRLRPDGALEALMDALDREKDPEATRAIIASLGQVSDPSSLQALEKRARLPSEKDVRLAAVSAIASIGGLESLSILKALEATEPDPGVRRHLERWIEKMK